MGRWRLTRAAVLSACLVGGLTGLTACATSTGGQPSAAPGSHTPVVSAPASSGPGTSGPGTSALPPGSPSPTGFPSSTLPSSSTSGSLDAQSATAALLTTSDLGTAPFTTTPFRYEPEPGPCQAATAPSVEDQVPTVVHTGVDFGLGQKAAIEEEVLVYPDTASATNAFSLGSAGLNCRTGSIHSDDGTSTSAAISAPKSATLYNGIKCDQTTAWQLTTSRYDIGLLATRFGSVLVTLDFITARGAKFTAVNRIVAIATEALQRVKDAI